MTPQALKMLTSFIILIAVINSIYYAIYLTFDPATRRMHHMGRLRPDASRSKLRIPILKVVWIRGPNHTRIKQSMKVYWAPEYSCSESFTKFETTTAVTTSETEYRDPEEYPYTEFSKGAACPSYPTLYGPTDWRSGLDPLVMERVFSLLQPGGAYTPTECVTKHHVAVIVPYKGSHGLLLLFLFTLHIALLKQQIEYQVFVVREFNKSRALNSGKFFNIGFLEAYKLKPNTTWTCFVFHDPYLAPMDARNLYRCWNRPRQLFNRVGTVGKKNNTFGGVVAMRPDMFRAVNGFSNLYYDTDSIYHDMYDRLIAANYTIENPSPFAKYDDLRMMIMNNEYGDSSRLSSSTSTLFPTMAELTSMVTEPQADGLSTLSYTGISELKLTHTLLAVDMETNSPNGLNKLKPAFVIIPRNPTLPSTLTTDETTKATISKATSGIRSKPRRPKHTLTRPLKRTPH